MYLLYSTGVGQIYLWMNCYNFRDPLTLYSFTWHHHQVKISFGPILILMSKTKTSLSASAVVWVQSKSPTVSKLTVVVGGNGCFPSWPQTSEYLAQGEPMPTENTLLELCALLLRWNTNHVEAADLNENPLRFFSLTFTFLLLHPLPNSHKHISDRE